MMLPNSRLVYIYYIYINIINIINYNMNLNLNYINICMCVECGVCARAKKFYNLKQYSHLTHESYRGYRVFFNFCDTRFAYSRLHSTNDHKLSYSASVYSAIQLPRRITPLLSLLNSIFTLYTLLLILYTATVDIILY